MSAVPTNTAPDHVNVEIDGKALQVPKGSMIIHAADKAGIAIPRFCYHDKLSIAANCRMCLVDVEKAPKPMPACATPVMEGMRVYTQSKRALDSQRNVMEFLLINHPLDCPICDQGGECELQDVAMGYGRSVSRFNERKRVVADEDLGPLVATDMTRCIHCTRCVRFTGEIAGTYELGGMGRGEHLEIGTYIGKSVESELSGNIIDVCPVGALTNKVFRFRARPWELIARESIGWHDALGSNLWLHTRRGEVLRTVPRENEAVNECWLSDRDRYSHQGLNAADRATRPMIRGADGTLKAVGWDEALDFVAAGIRNALSTHGGGELAALVAPFVSAEEGHLLATLVRALGSDNIDHRLRVLDFTDGAPATLFARPLAAIEQVHAALLVGCNPRQDQPLLNHRLRKAARKGAAVMAINPLALASNFDLDAEIAAGPWRMVDALAGVARAATEAAGVAVPEALAQVIAAASVDAAHARIAARLRESGNAVVLLGDYAVHHQAASLLRALARLVAEATGAACNELPPGPNAQALARVGCTPRSGGADALRQMRRGHRVQIVYQCEAVDSAQPAAFDAACRAAEFVVAFTAYGDVGTATPAHAVLPVALPPECEGSYMNVDGRIQRVSGGAKAPGDTRPGWRVLRALGSHLGLPGFDFTEFGELSSRVHELLATPAPQTPRGLVAARPPLVPDALTRIAQVPIYRTDAVVRRAAALQSTPLAAGPQVVLHPADALARGLAAGARAVVASGQVRVELPVAIDVAVPHGCVRIDYGHPETALLPEDGSPLSIQRVGT
jgi:NADH-quinone oxidoreductase subunit G